MPLIPEILPALDACRTIGGRLGMRVYTIDVLRRTTVRAQPGSAPYVDTRTQLVNSAPDGFECPVRVKQVSRADAIASGGRYTNQDLRVGPMTPSYVDPILGESGGYTDATMDPRSTGFPTQILWIVNGPGLPKDTIFEKIGEEATSMHYYVVLHSTGRQI